MKTLGAINPRVLAAALPETWFPNVIGEVNDAYIKIARLKGSLAWHTHDLEDELFFILHGRLRIEMEKESIELNEGELYIVPRGVRHNPVADMECHVLLVESKSTQHTGDITTAQTRSIAEQL